MEADDYKFTDDWFSENIPVWEHILNMLRPSTALEVGSYEGRASCFLIQACSRFGDFQLSCIDTWQGSAEHDATSMSGVESRFDHNVALATAQSPSAEIEKLRGRSCDRLPELRGRLFDFIYIDGSHSAQDVLVDAVLSFPLLRVGGVAIFDDYLWRPLSGNDPLDAPKAAIDAFINIYQRKLDVLRDIPLYQIAIQKTEH